ncbi:dTDP-4-dehydrorhamnose reductase [Synechococcus sp. RSCCF101]|uniref:dTDP-4-dehydrorhamnose reductase n=1 Tax=Synechococcus sp. RSCCF101 TaxID=2511069 RepID=UPI001247F0FA|nr:dTDP-4-dehydrorhamnose reductase [Synechococcus sp. RSCCF101]QEY32414.1 dTDP-4-dehydrorhamnose reductase [Synechococcus sp. RSCCF101]
MKVLLTGAGGQLGQQLVASVPERLAGEPLQLLATGRSELDLADAEACRAAVATHRPDWILNAGAYTAVDRAEQEPDLAQRVNGAAPRALAEAAAACGARMLQVSTDFVFNGRQGHPYQPDQPVAPLGVYGASKASGEAGVLEALGPERACVLRTSWVYGPVGRNFCLTMLRLHRSKAEAGEPLGVVADHVGCPTSTLSLAEACWAVIGRGVGGIQQISDAGAASWYDFAVAIGELGVAAGLLERSARVRPISTAEYPTPAERPAYSLLASAASYRRLQLEPVHWRERLRQVLAQVQP